MELLTGGKKICTEDENHAGNNSFATVEHKQYVKWQTEIMLFIAGQ